MDIKLQLNASDYGSDTLVLLGAFSKTEKKGKSSETSLVNAAWPKQVKEEFSMITSSDCFNGSKGTSYIFNTSDGRSFHAIGLGEKSKYTEEDLRKAVANAVKGYLSNTEVLSLDLDSFKIKGNIERTSYLAAEALELTAYQFVKHFSAEKKHKLTTVFFDSTEKKTKQKKCSAAVSKAQQVAESVNYARDLVNEPPNVLNSETYAKRVVADAKKIKGVKTKVLGRAELKKEKANLFLSVNNGSAYQPQLVHLTYTPKKVTSKTKHIALVGKGLTFDTGGYSLKPGGSMVNMKFDMAGSATVYAAFRAAAMSGANVKITCILGMTDNAVNSKATMPDSIVKGRNGKTVEILNTDAEGRLVLADCLDYACDLKPDAIIDAATLTGACLIALGTEVCGVMGNDQKLVNSLLKSANNTSEYMWQLPIIEEFSKDMKGSISDLKNIGGSRWGGTAKAAAFLQEFVKDDISWAHLDIAGIGDSQSHLPYCPSKGASGSIVRSLVDYIENAK